MTQDADDWTDYESGPFCRHWSDPSDCEATCNNCGHGCVEHGFGDGAEPSCSRCDCPSWIDRPRQAPDPALAHPFALPSQVDISGGRCLFSGCRNRSSTTVEGVPICAEHADRARREAAAGESEDPAVREQERSVRARIAAQRSMEQAAMDESRRRWAEAEGERDRRVVAGLCVQCGEPACRDARLGGLFLCQSHWTGRLTARLDMTCQNCSASAIRETMTSRRNVASAWGIYECPRCEAHYQVWRDASTAPPDNQPRMSFVPSGHVVEMRGADGPNPRLFGLSPSAVIFDGAPTTPFARRPREAPRPRPKRSVVRPTRRVVDLPED